MPKTFVFTAISKFSGKILTSQVLGLNMENAKAALASNYLLKNFEIIDLKEL